MCFTELVIYECFILIVRSQVKCLDLGEKCICFLLGWGLFAFNITEVLFITLTFMNIVNKLIRLLLSS